MLPLLFTLAAAVAATPLPAHIEFLAADALTPVGAGQALLDVGSVSASQRCGRLPCSRITRAVGVKVQAPAMRATSARLWAHVQSDDGRCRVKIDGQPLSAIPRLVDAAAPLGRARSHVIEIEVPASAAAGALSSAVIWRAEFD
jgi:hypothetical protein